MDNLEENQRIIPLPIHLVDQIKAGEVIERPASLVKELIENSIDAGAREISIHIKENGLELINIQDDGKGILFDDMSLAFQRHATSKIKRLEDIYHLTNYGFRGEALASISSISRLTCNSVPINKKDNGGKIVIHGGTQVSLTPFKNITNGTSIFVRDLFYNTPARLKFIKSKISEKNALKRIINAFIIANPKVGFNIKWDDKDKEIFRVSSEKDLSKRISKIFFKSKDPFHSLIHVDSEYDGHSLTGYISSSSSKGNVGKVQYLFANKRLFYDYQLHRIVLQTLENLWPMKETGHYCLFLTIPPSEIDVNVHPNKTQIKFLKSSLVCSLISSGIKKAIYETQEKSNADIASNLHTDNSFSSLIQQNNDELTNQHLSNFEVNQTSSIFKLIYNLSDKHLLIHLSVNENIYIVNVSRLIGHFFFKNLKANFPFSENNITPLLISEPFYKTSGSIDNFFTFLINCGFEVDRLDQETIVLRSIPLFLSNISNITPCFDQLLSFLENKSVKTVSIDTLQHFFSENFTFPSSNLNQNQLETIFKSITLNDLVSNKIVSLLNDKKLEGIFEK